MREALFLFKTVRNLYPEIPFLIATTDKQSHEYLKENTDEKTRLYYLLPQKVEGVINHNNYHKADLIYLKFNILTKAIEAFGSSIFCDADLFLIHPFNGPEDCSVGLSHNLAVSRDIAQNAASEGIFNAGLLYTSSLEFISWWRGQFLRAKEFYEQRALNKISGYFRTDYFDTKHNYGWWRNSVNNRTVHSFHVHLDDKLDHRMHPRTMLMVRKFRKKAVEYIEKNHPNIKEQYDEIFINS